MQNSKFLEYTSYLLFDIDGSRYVFNGENAAVYKINDYYYNILVNKTQIYKLDNKDREDLIKISLITNRLNDTDYKSYQIEINSITLFLNDYCNLKCKYCYETKKGHSRLSFETAKRIIDNFVKEKSSLTINFFGGEPLLSFELIKKIINYTKIINLENKINFQYSMTTNGTLINSEIAEFLIDNNFQVTLSIDGVKSKHDLYRVDTNGNGSYDKAINGLKLIESLHPIIRTTLTKHNSDLIEIVSNFIPFKVQCVYCAPNFEDFLDENEVIKLYSKYLDMIDFFHYQLKIKKYDNCLVFYNIISLLKRIHKPKKIISYCDACIKSISINCNGDVYPCHRFTSNNYKKIGFFEDTNIKDKIKNVFNTDFLNNSCKECWAKLLCGGYCKYNDFSFPSYKEIYCDFQKKYLKNIIKLYLTLTPEEKIFLKLDL